MYPLNPTPPLNPDPFADTGFEMANGGQDIEPRTLLLALLLPSLLPAAAAAAAAAAVTPLTHPFPPPAFIPLLPLPLLLLCPGKRGPLTQQLQVLYTALVEADIAAGRDADWEEEH
jgi:hypothetical protein